MPKTKTSFKQPRGAIKLTIYELAEMLGLPDYSTVEEQNVDAISEQGYYADKAEREEIARWESELSEEEIEARAEKARYKAEEEAQKDLFSQWVGGVDAAAETIWGFHGFDIQSRHADTARIVTPARGETWASVAAKIAQTINGVGLTYVEPEEYSRAPKKWVAEHLGSMQVQPEVYGTASAERIYEASFR